VNIPLTIKNGSAIRGAGVALACLLPGVHRRTGAIVASYAAGWPLDRPGLQFFVVVPDEDEEPWKRAVLPVLTSGTSWTVVMSLAALGARKLPMPTAAAALLLGAGVALGDSAMGGVAERMRAKAMAMADAAAAKTEEAEASTESAAMEPSSD
jgi:hypothetical protein